MAGSCEGALCSDLYYLKAHNAATTQRPKETETLDLPTYNPSTWETREGEQKLAWATLIFKVDWLRSFCRQKADG